MSRLLTYWSVLIIFLLSGCASERIVTVWKAENQLPVTYDRVLVAGIISDRKDDSARVEIENKLIADLAAKGIKAVSSYQEFGPAGLRMFNEEATFVALCDSGIDAVLTFAQVEQASSEELEKGHSKKYSSAYYYNRIWSYKNLPLKTEEEKQRVPYVWECILFDLNSLQSRAVLLARPYDNGNFGSSSAMLAGEALNRLFREKIIRKQQSTVSSPKPF